MRRSSLRIAPAHVAQQSRTAVGLPPARGLLIESVRAQSPAHAARLAPGDLLIEANGSRLQSLTCLERALPATAGAVSAVVQRGQAVRNETIVVPALNAAPAPADQQLPAGPGHRDTSPTRPVTSTPSAPEAYSPHE